MKESLRWRAILVGLKMTSHVQVSAPASGCTRDEQRVVDSVEVDRLAQRLSRSLRMSKYLGRMAAEHGGLVEHPDLARALAKQEYGQQGKCGPNQSALKSEVEFPRQIG